MANSVGPDQTAPIGAVCSGSTLFASILNSLVILGNCLQQTTSADDFSRRHFQMHFFLGALRVKHGGNEAHKDGFYGLGYLVSSFTLREAKIKDFKWL